MTRTDRVLALALLVALALRVAYVLLQSRLAIFDIAFEAGDSRLYFALANEIAAGHGMRVDGEPTAYVGPGYPLFLALLLKLGADTSAVGLVQAVLGTATCWLAARTTAELCADARWSSERRSVAIVLTAFGVAIYPHLIFWTGYVLTETLFVALAGAALLLVLRASRGSRPHAAFAAGTLAAAAALCRPAYLAFGVVLIVWLLIRARATRAWLSAFAFAVGLVLPIAAWAVRNEVELGAPIVTTTEAGFVFYAGNSREGTGGSRGYLDSQDYRVLDLPPGLSEVEADAAYRQEALRQIAEDPLAAIRKWPSKLYNMWRPTYENASTRNLVVSVVSYVPVLILGVWGAVALARAGPSTIRVLPSLFLLTWVSVHVLVAGLIRFRLPAEPVLIGLAAIQIASWKARYSKTAR